MREFLIGILTAAMGALGFSFVFRVDKKHLAPATLGGALTWGVYLLVIAPTQSIFAASLAAAAAATFYAELLAFLCKTPATAFLYPALIPLVPGGSLYYTMSELIMHNYSACAEYALRTVEYMVGISGGVVAASLAVYAFKYHLDGHRRKKAGKNLR